MQLSATQTRVLKRGIILTFLIGVAGFSMIMGALIARDRKTFLVVKSTCEVKFDLKNRLWNVSVEVLNVTYSTLVDTGVTSDGETKCWYRSNSLPGSLQIGKPPSTRIEFIVLMAGVAFMGVFLVFLVAVIILTLRVKSCVDKDGDVVWVNPII